MSLKPLTKGDVFTLLHKLKKEGVNTEHYLKHTMLSESVPFDTIVFINRHKPLPQFDTYNRLYENRRSNKIYRNIVQDVSVSDKAIALSSLLTQSLIAMKKVEDLNSRKYLADVMQLEDITHSLQEYTLNDNEVPILKICEQLSDTFNKLFREDLNELSNA